MISLKLLLSVASIANDIGGDCLTS